MAKKKKRKQKQEQNEKENHRDSVGWLFFCVWFVLLLGPCVYGVFQIVTEDANDLVPFGAGVVFAAVAAALVAWIVNSILQFRAKRRRIAVRKVARKK